MIKTSICQKDVTIIDIYAPNKRAPKYKKQKLIEMLRKNKKFNKNTWRILYLAFKNE